MKKACRIWCTWLCFTPEAAALQWWMEQTLLAAVEAPGSSQSKEHAECELPHVTTSRLDVMKNSPVLCSVCSCTGCLDN